MAASLTERVVRLVQNRSMGKQLTEIQASLGSMQSLQMLTSVSSVDGIGVTVANTAIISSKMKAVDGKLSTIEQAIENLLTQWRDMNLRKALGQVETQLERLQEVPARKGTNPVLQAVEAELHSCFNTLHTGVSQVFVEAQIDPDLLQTLLEALVISAAAQFKALYQMDETEAALRRAQTQSGKMQTLAFEMPKDKLSQRLGGDGTIASQIADQSSQIRLVMASRPSLTQNVLNRDISGRRYLDVLEEENESPLLILPCE